MKKKSEITTGFALCLQWPIWMSVMLVILNIAVYLADVEIGYMVSFVVAIYIGFAIYFQFYRKTKLLKQLVEYGSDYAQIQKRLLNDMVVPYGMCDEKGRILWMNYEFLKVLGVSEDTKRHLNQIFDESTERFFPEPSETERCTHVTYRDRCYRLTLKRISLTDAIADVNSGLGMQDVELYAVYLYDETEILQITKLYQDNKPVVGLIYLDNYDEALEALEEVRRSLLVALVDRKITQYFGRYQGILKKLEKDKYLFVCAMEHMPKMKENRFSVLEDAKSVNIGNEMAVTISIGIGLNGDGFAQNYEYARTAIDLALGRGGDQAVVKDTKQVEYFGGKTHSMEKNTHVKARVKAHALRELIETKEKLIVMGHSLSDVDSVGAAIGIYRAAKLSGKRVYIVLNQITPAIQPMVDGFKENSDYEPDLFINNETALSLLTPDTIVVMVDVNRPSYTECPELLKRAKNIVVLDHHRQSDERVENPVLSYIEPFASSACEMVAEILQYYSDDLKLKSLDADALYAGIVIDTNNFLSKTGIRTFEAAAFLRRKGADVTRVRKLFRDDMEEYRIRAKTIERAEVFSGNFALAVCEGENCNNLNVVAAQTANELLGIRGIQASFVLAEFNQVIYVSARSIDEVNVQVIMEKLGGGGHMSIAGAQLRDMSIEEAYTLVKETVLEMRRTGVI